MSRKNDTSNFKLVTKIERQAGANKACKHRGHGGGGNLSTGNGGEGLFISLQYTHPPHTHTRQRRNKIDKNPYMYLDTSHQNVQTL